jgi:hypothetical protein
MYRFIRPYYIAVALMVLGSALVPRSASGFWDEDSLKIAGIAAGSALALGIIVVLVAGTIEDLKSDDSDLYSFSRHLLNDLRDAHNNGYFVLDRISCRRIGMRIGMPYAMSQGEMLLSARLPVASSYPKQFSCLSIDLSTLQALRRHTMDTSLLLKRGTPAQLSLSITSSAKEDGVHRAVP